MGWYLFEILYISSNWKLVKMFLKSSAMESGKFFSKWMRDVDLCENSFFDDIFESQYLLEIYHTLLTIKNSENVIKCVCFWKDLRWRALIFWNEDGVFGDLCKNIFLDDLLRSQYLFGISQTSLFVKNSERVVNDGDGDGKR